MSIFIVLYHTGGVVRLDIVSSGVYFARLFDLCAPIALGYFLRFQHFCSTMTKNVYKGKNKKKMEISYDSFIFLIWF